MSPTKAIHRLSRFSVYFVTRASVSQNAGDFGYQFVKWNAAAEASDEKRRFIELFRRHVFYAP